MISGTDQLVAENRQSEENEEKKEGRRESESEQRTMPLGSRASLMVSLSRMSALLFQSAGAKGQRDRQGRKGNVGNAL